MSPLTYSTDLKCINKCIEMKLIEETRSDKFKTSNWIRYSESQYDLDVKDWLENELIPEWDQSKQMS